MNRKQRVAAKFSAAAAAYDAAAEAQDIAAERLAERVLSIPLPASPRVLEIGCGTGLLTRRLLPRIGGNWTVTDIATEMVEAARLTLGKHQTIFRVMDGEHPDLAEHSVDLIVSNLAAQWFSDPVAAFARLARLLAPGGRLLLTTLGPASFQEWRSAHALHGLTSGIPDYPASDALAAGLENAQVIAERITVRYADGLAFLRALKAIGATVPAAGHRPLPPASLKLVLATVGRPCPITYEVLTLTYFRGCP